MSNSDFYIPSLEELKRADISQLEDLAAKIRERLIAVTSKNGGHLASSLGAVELIIALHKVFDSPHDKLVFDVGHQAYTHKILTGRADVFDTLRVHGGISGFTRREESIHDVHDAGHASDSLSTALGLAIARDLNKTDESIAVLVGDAALSGGMAFEALNHIGHLGLDMTILLNDNEMSISKNVGALSLYLSKARMSKPYTKFRDTVEGGMSRAGRVGKFLVNAGEVVKGSFKKLMVPGTFFEDMSIIYIGPIDGHNIDLVSRALLAAQKTKGPVLIHAVTQKGRGYAPAELKPDVFHGISSYDPNTGKAYVGAQKKPSYTDVFSRALIDKAQTNDQIVAITAAMPDGTGLAAFNDAYPTRFFDVGIAEQHAVTLASGLAIGKKLPVVAIYSSFLQRAYDQIIINVALQKLHVVFCIDRGGVVGEDGTTHHGVFDLAYLRSIPNMMILAPATAAQLNDGLHIALDDVDGPIAIRYPRGEANDSDVFDTGLPLEIGRAQKIYDDSEIKKDDCAGDSVLSQNDVAILALGAYVQNAYEAAFTLSKSGIKAVVYNMLWVKPIDTQAVQAAMSAKLVVTIEDGTVVGGFGSAVLEAMAALKPMCSAQTPQVINLGIGDQFVGQGSRSELMFEQGLAHEQIAERIKHVFEAQDRAK